MLTSDFIQTIKLFVLKTERTDRAAPGIFGTQTHTYVLAMELPFRYCAHIETDPSEPCGLLLPINSFNQEK